LAGGLGQRQPIVRGLNIIIIGHGLAQGWAQQ
jgi:hypothetical protein